MLLKINEVIFISKLWFLNYLIVYLYSFRVGEMVNYWSNICKNSKDDRI